MSRMPIINFDEQFESFVSEWVTVHRSEYETFDALEADLPRVYMLFLNTRAKWLGNLTPGSYLPSLRIRRFWWTGCMNTAASGCRCRIC